MFIFTRVAVVAPGHRRPASAFITDVTAHLNATMPTTTSAWNVVFGGPVGTVLWSTMIDDLASYLDAADTMRSTSAYLDKLAAGSNLFTGAPEDSLGEVIYTAGDTQADPHCMTSTTRVIARDQADAVAWSIDVADLAHSTTGTTAVLLRNVYGDVDRLQWLSGYPDNATVAAATAELRTSEAYQEHLENGSSFFVPDTCRQSLFRRMS
jgi:hypothetical protein